jgi:hypothetical protein
MLDQMEAQFAPPDHEVFQLTPPEFDHWANIYYERMGKPVITRDSFWNVHCDLLNHFRQGPDVEADLHIPLSSYMETTHRIEEEEIPLLADQQPLRRVAEMHGEGFAKSNRGRPADAGQFEYGGRSKHKHRRK